MQIERQTKQNHRNIGTFDCENSVTLQQAYKTWQDMLNDRPALERRWRAEQGNGQERLTQRHHSTSFL